MRFHSTLRDSFFLQHLLRQIPFDLSQQIAKIIPMYLLHVPTRRYPLLFYILIQWCFYENVYKSHCNQRAHLLCTPGVQDVTIPDA